MKTALDKQQLIREEFECFVRIGMDRGLRRKVEKLIEQRLTFGNPFASLPGIYFETRSETGELQEMWYLETDSDQMRRLAEFLRRFSVDDVRLINAMLHR